MKKLIALMAIGLFTMACSDVSEDTIPDPITPELDQIDNQQSTGVGEGPKKPRT